MELDSADVIAHELVVSEAHRKRARAAEVQNAVLVQNLEEFTSDLLASLGERQDFGQVVGTDVSLWSSSAGTCRARNVLVGRIAALMDLNNRGQYESIRIQRANNP
jgi:hypothetical protein